MVTPINNPNCTAKLWFITVFCVGMACFGPDPWSIGKFVAQSVVPLWWVTSRNSEYTSPWARQQFLQRWHPMSILSKLNAALIILDQYPNFWYIHICRFVGWSLNLSILINLLLDPPISWLAWDGWNLYIFCHAHELICSAPFHFFTDLVAWNLQYV